MAVSAKVLVNFIGYNTVWIVLMESTRYTGSDLSNLAEEMIVQQWNVLNGQKIHFSGTVRDDVSLEETSRLRSRTNDTTEER